MKTIIFIEAEILGTSPLFIGDDNKEILIDDENQMAYLPATSIAGSFRSFLGNDDEKVKKLFGDSENRQMSKVYIRDAFAKIHSYDLRDGLRIDGEYGTNVQGAKVERVYLSAGLKFSLSFKIQINNEEDKGLKTLIYSALNGLNSGLLRFGGHKSSGLGVFELIEATEWEYNLKDNDELMRYLNKVVENKKDILMDIKSSKLNADHVEFIMEGKLTSPLIIGAPRSFNPAAADDTSIKSGNDEYIVPGSSLKGLLRYRMETISNYFNRFHIVSELFGQINDTNEDGKKNMLSRIFVQESVIDDSDYSYEIMYNRIKLDKFTSGVSYGSLMQDIPVKGNISFNITYRKTGDKGYDDYAIGLISLALRDLGMENISIGGQENIGRGKFKANTLLINTGDEKISIDFYNKSIENRDILAGYVNSIKSPISGGEN